MQKRGAERGLRELKGNVWRRIFRSDPRRQTTPHLHCDFVPLTKRGITGERRDSDKEMRRTQEKFLEAMQESVPRAKFARLEPEKAHNLTA